MRSAEGRMGGTEGNAILTSAEGAVLTVLLLVEGVTVLALDQLLDVHMFVGLILIGPVLLKLASTGYRFVRYYTGSPTYRAAGPPQIVLRLLAPVLVVATVIVLATGVWLMLLGHRSDTVMTLHKASFILWGAVFAVHFLFHLPRMLRSLGSDWSAPARRAVPGAVSRGGAVLLSVAIGVVVALVSVAAITSWHGG